MILVDLNQVLISNLMAQTRGEFDELPDKNMLRHMVLNSLRGYNLKFKDAPQLRKKQKLTRYCQKQGRRSAFNNGSTIYLFV